MLCDCYWLRDWLSFAGCYVVDDRPELRHLSRHVKEDVCASGPEMWFDLGIELLDHKDVAGLNVIKSDVTKSLSQRCLEMFKLWLERQPNASWRHLITALKKIRMYKLVSDVERLLASESRVATVGQQVLQEGQHTAQPSLHAYTVWQEIFEDKNFRGFR